MRIFTILTLFSPFICAANLQVTGGTTNPSCGDSNGSITVYVTGGLAPYTFAWDDGPTTQNRSGLPAGTYSITVTDAMLMTATYSATLNGGTFNADHLNFVTYAGNFACPGQSNGSFILLLQYMAGVAPYTVDATVNGAPMTASGDDGNGNPIFSGLATNDLIGYTATDVNGCHGGDSFLMYGPQNIPPTVSGILPACAGNNGTVTITPSGDWPVDIVVFDDLWQPVYSSSQSAMSITVNTLAPGSYTVRQSWSWMIQPCGSILDVPFTIPDLGPDCGSVVGSSWYDVNSDCVHDAGEVGIPFSPLLIQPGNQNVITDYDGSFSYRIVNGNYTLAQQDPDLVPICPVTQPVPFTMNTNVQTIDLANGSTEPLDIVLNTAGGNARPGMTYGMHAEIRNLSPQASGPVSVTMTFDPLLTYVNANPAPASVAGNTIIWDLAAFGSFGMSGVGANFLVPLGTPLGTVLSSTIGAGNTLPESTLANNTTVENAIVVSSYDPNEKTVSTSTRASDTQYFIDQDEYLDYTIRFQNTGTAAAIDVVVTDTLAPELDMSTFEQGAASHTFNLSFRPGRVVEWRFTTINLPDSGSDEAASHGLVSFRIRPAQPLLPGTFISNSANIFFDLNAPVITDEATVVAEMSTGVPGQEQERWRVAPNPATDRITLMMPAGTIGPLDVQVIAADGRTLLAGSMRQDRSLDIRALPVGLYSLRILGGSNLRMLRFIKR